MIVVAVVVSRKRDGIAIPAWRTQRGRPGVEDGRFDFAFERTPLRPPMSWSSWMVITSFPRLQRQQETVVCQSGA